MPDHGPVIVVGGGWAGLAAAIELCRQQVPVLLLESSRQLGGRARSVRRHDRILDNGQHLLLGGYRETLGLLQNIGVTEQQVLQRRPLCLHWQRDQRKSICLSTPRLPAPMHLLWGLLWARGLSLRDRYSALRFSRALLRMNFRLEQDCSVRELLDRYRQTPAVIHALWEPLCLGALNTHLQEASAQVFLRTLQDSFTRSRQDSDLLLTRADLGSLLPVPGLDYIETHGGNVRLGQRVTGLTIIGDSIDSVILKDGQFHASRVILATPHTITRRLIRPHQALATVEQQLQAFSDRPICTVYLQYDPAVGLDHPMTGLLGKHGQWVFDRGLSGQHGLMAVVISGEGEHMAWEPNRLCDTIRHELASVFPHWPKPLSCQVIREKRATFASTVNIQQQRPAVKTPVKGLWLAGDYTDVGLPATLEAAVKSGLRCAREILASLS